MLTSNFTSMDRTLISKELSLMKSLNPRLTRNTWHTSLNFAKGEQISDDRMKQIGEEYMKRMGFDNNLHVIFRHHDSEHPHCHILALRNRFDGTVVSDSHNYQKSEAIIRDLENKYGLIKVQSSRQSLSRAPDKEELEMILRTGKASSKLLLQEKVRDAIKHSKTMEQFINRLERSGVNVLFNQASTGRVSGITYQIPGFKIRGQALGNQFKFGSITKQVTYEQNRDSQTIGQANSRTRSKFGKAEQAIQAIRISKTGVPFSKEWYHFAKSRGINGLPEIPFGFVDPSQKRNLRIDERATGNEKITKEASGNLDTELPFRHSAAPGILGGIAGLLDSVANVEQEKRLKKKDEQKKRGISR